MASEADLIHRVLSLLQVVGAGQQVEAEDGALVRRQIAPKLAELSRRKVIYVADSDDFDPEMLQWLAMLIAQDVAPDFGRAMDLDAIRLAEARLREMQAETQTDAPIVATYF